MKKTDRRSARAQYDPDPIVITTDGYVIYDPADGYTIIRGERNGALRAVVDGVMVEIPLADVWDGADGAT